METVYLGGSRMGKKVSRRKCIICNKIKQTTNTQTPYIGEECYKTKGRNLLLNMEKHEDNIAESAAETATAYAKKEIGITVTIYGVIGFIIGVIVMHLVHLTGKI